LTLYPKGDWGPESTEETVKDFLVRFEKTKNDILNKKAEFNAVSVFAEGVRALGETLAPYIHPELVDNITLHYRLVQVEKKNRSPDYYR
jgi:hypothetical protein